MEQQNVRKFKDHEGGRQYADQQTEDDEKAKNVAEKGKKLTKDMEDVLDEIDEVLEANAADFIKNYVQKGGE